MTSRWLAVALALSLARLPHAAAEPSGREVYDKAVVALAAGDPAEAIRLSMQAATMPGPQQLGAKFLYGDALALAGELARARDVFVALRDGTAGAPRAKAEAKLAEVVKKLGEKAPTAKAKKTDDAYTRALEAIRRGDLRAAQTNAMTASAETGPHQLDAKVLYADILARQGSHARAKDMYVALRKLTTGELRTQITAKLAAENRALKLPESDGAD